MFTCCALPYEVAPLRLLLRDEELDAESPLLAPLMLPGAFNIEPDVEVEPEFEVVDKVLVCPKAAGAPQQIASATIPAKDRYRIMLRFPKEG